MLIGYVLKMYPRFSETFVLNEILELERRGVTVRIFSLLKPDDGRFHARLARVKARVTYLPEYPRHQFLAVWPSCRALIRRDPRRFLRNLLYALLHPRELGLKQFLRACVLSQELIQEPVDHLHAHFASAATSVALLAHLFTGIPYTFTAHAKDIYLESIDTRLQSDKLRLANFVVTVSEFNRSYLSDLITQDAHPHASDWLDGRAPPAPSRPSIRRLYNGVDLIQFQPVPLASAERSRTPVILSVGRLIEKKGFEDLIRACAILRAGGPNFTCEIVGKGPRESTLTHLIQDLGLSSTVILAGPTPVEDVVASYARATVFALPCIVGADGNRDGTPTVLLEAMAMGLPVVSTRLTGIPEIVDDGSTGLLVPERDPAALAAALSRLLADPDLRLSMGSLARAKVQREFDLRNNVAVLHGWFAESIGQSQPLETVPGTRLTHEPSHENPVPLR